MRNFIQVYFFICITSWSLSQDCLEQVLAIEDSIYADRKNLNNKTAFVHYKVRSEDWEKEVVQSEVKMYQDQKHMYFLSEQVDIFSDDKEMFLVLKQQKVILGNISQKNPKASEDEFLKFRKTFLKNCEVQSCYFSDSLKGIKTLKLTVKEDVNELVHIKSMTYKIDIKNNRLISNSVTYTKKYKLKSMEMNYMDYKFLNSYNFSKPSKLILNQKGKLLEKYKGYEFIDDRN
jgi:hypothetical protein